MAHEQQDGIVIECSLMVKSAHFEYLPDLPARAGAGLLRYGAIAGHVLARRHEMQVGFILHAYHTSAGWSVSASRCLAQVCLGEYCALLWGARNPADGAERHLLRIGAIKHMAVRMIVAAQRSAVETLGAVDRGTDDTSYLGLAAEIGTGRSTRLGSIKRYQESTSRYKSYGLPVGRCTTSRPVSLLLTWLTIYTCSHGCGYK